MCSIQCQGKWQSINLSGMNANGYNHTVSIEERTIVCQWCNKDFQVKPYEIENQKFCSKECRQSWFAQEYSQSEEFKEKASIRAAKMLEDDIFNKRVTGIQKKINIILDKLNVENKKEKAFNKVTMDNYLVESKLMIENMGTFHHCDHRKYPHIIYERQVNRIRMDKIKHSYIKNNYNVEILYLWEEEINNNPLLCKLLIELYINNNGVLENYHSFNYILNEYNNLVLNNVISVPYMEWDINNLHPLIDLSVKEKMSHKQLDKWITFNCEYCGKEKEQLIKDYKGKAHHYCSIECSSLSRRKRQEVTCDNCGKTIEVIQNKYETNKHFFCNQDCQHEYQKKFGWNLNNFMDITEFSCEFCGKITQQKTCEYKRNGHHFCSSSCSSKYYHQHNNKNKTYIKCVCENCGIEVYKSNGDYKKSKHHFCTAQCAYEYRKNHKPN
jgi:hypothetical protein